MFPKIKPHVIKEVNRAIDSPQFIDTFVNNSYPRYDSSGKYNNEYDYLKLGNKNKHREINHDMRSGLFAGYRIGGAEGARVAANHIFLDALSDKLVHSYGSEGRDIVESIFVYLRKKQFQRL